MNIHIIHYLDSSLERKLDQVIRALVFNQEKIMAKLDALQAEVAAVSSTDDAILVFIDGLVTQLKNAGSDQAAIDQITADLEAKRTTLAAAMVTPPPAA